ncbi:MAG: hypothetical protein B6U76_09030 [Desulfurococcales archaeon ex4484_217_2]|nr:MAG: hypothetical protein B6U76_09030 [Desulfurococcales archaeon ex4484_217_2]
MGLSKIGKALGFRKPWIEKVKVENLEKEKLKVDNHILLISKEIEKLEREKKELFRQGIGKSDIEKLLLAEKIKELDAEVRMKIREYRRLMKQRRALSNLIRLKKWEKQLKEKGIWEKIKSIEPDKLMQMLTEVEFKEAQFEKNLDKINEILGAEYAKIEVDEATREIMQMWEKVEKAELSPEEVEEKLTVKVAEKEEEEKETA